MVLPERGFDFCRGKSFYAGTQGKFGGRHHLGLNPTSARRRRGEIPLVQTREEAMLRQVPGMHLGPVQNVHQYSFSMLSTRSHQTLNQSIPSHAVRMRPH
jgi:hypothetical protein